jgi:hypothetical protein
MPNVHGSSPETYSLHWQLSKPRRLTPQISPPRAAACTSPLSDMVAKTALLATNTLLLATRIPPSAGQSDLTTLHSHAIPGSKVRSSLRVPLPRGQRPNRVGNRVGGGVLRNSKPPSLPKRDGNTARARRPCMPLCARAEAGGPPCFTAGSVADPVLLSDRPWPVPWAWAA